MNNIVCIDYENRADIKKLFCFSDVKFVSFIGAEQQDKIKIEEGIKIINIKIRMEYNSIL